MLAALGHLAWLAVAGFPRLKTETMVREVDRRQGGRTGERLIVGTRKEKDLNEPSRVCDGTLWEGRELGFFH
ncbi:MAG TPA: hypothetical protein VF370_06040 [Candidatus Cryosericum sp.]